MASLELRIPPVVVMTVAAVLMWLVAVVRPALTIFVIAGKAFTTAFYLARPFVTVVLFAIGLLIALAGVVSFHRAATTVDPMNPRDASSLVTTGIYRFTRNPMYLGMLLILLGWAVWLAHPFSLLMLPLFVAYMNRFQIRPEERVLRAKFGELFDAYARASRRWI